jgi:hypothetical protein
MNQLISQFQLCFERSCQSNYCAIMQLKEIYMDILVLFCMFVLKVPIIKLLRFSSM